MLFFGGVQVEIFRRLSKRIDDFMRNAQFLSEEARSRLDDIEDILFSDEPYSRIKDLPRFESMIETSLGDSLLSLKHELQEKIRSATEDIDSELAGYNGFPDEFKRSVMQPFNDIERHVTGSKDCTYVKLQIGSIDELSDSGYEKIESEKHIIREKMNTDDGVDEGSGIDVTPVKVITGTSLFRTTKDIETKEDLDAYLETLRAVMQKHLDDNNKIKVRLV